MIVLKGEYGSLIQIVKILESESYRIMEKRTYQKDRSRRNAAKKIILGKAARQDLHHVTFLLDPYRETM